MFCPWQLVSKSIQRQTIDSAAIKRRTWNQTTRGHVLEVCNEAISDLRSHISLIINTPYANTMNGLVSKNFDLITLDDATTNPAGISLERYVDGKLQRSSLAKEVGGSIQFAQAESGHIVVTFYPAEVILPDSKRTNSNRIVYQICDPQKLTKRKLKKILDVGISFLIETRNGSQRGWHTHWLFLKQTEMYKGIIIGVISSTLVSLTIEAVEGLIKLATATPPVP
ncbi:hypothetical protein DSECCO2_152370 [anaerobic digester metagenome]